MKKLETLIFSTSRDSHRIKLSTVTETTRSFLVPRTVVKGQLMHRAKVLIQKVEVITLIEMTGIHLEVMIPNYNLRITHKIYHNSTKRSKESTVVAKETIKGAKLETSTKMIKKSMTSGMGLDQSTILKSCSKIQKTTWSMVLVRNPKTKMV